MTPITLHIRTKFFIKFFMNIFKNPVTQYLISKKEVTSKAH